MVRRMKSTLLCGVWRRDVWLPVELTHFPLITFCLFECTFPHITFCIACHSTIRTSRNDLALYERKSSHFHIQSVIVYADVVIHLFRSLSFFYSIYTFVFERLSGSLVIMDNDRTTQLLHSKNAFI